MHAGLWSARVVFRLQAVWQLGLLQVPNHLGVVEPVVEARRLRQAGVVAAVVEQPVVPVARWLVAVASLAAKELVSQVPVLLRRHR